MQIFMLQPSSRRWSISNCCNHRVGGAFVINIYRPFSVLNLKNCHWLISEMDRLWTIYLDTRWPNIPIPCTPHHSHRPALLHGGGTCLSVNVPLNIYVSCLWVCKLIDSFFQWRTLGSRLEAKSKPAWKTTWQKHLLETWRGSAWCLFPRVFPARSVDLFTHTHTHTVSSSLCSNVVKTVYTLQHQRRHCNELLTDKRARTHAHTLLYIPAQQTWPASLSQLKRERYWWCALCMPAYSCGSVSAHMRTGSLCVHESSLEV